MNAASTHPHGVFEAPSPVPVAEKSAARGTRMPNASTRYQDTLTGLKLHFAAVGVSRDVARDTDELTQTARQYEQVPDTMSVPDALVVDEEVDAGAIDDPAGHEPGGTRCR